MRWFAPKKISKGGVMPFHEDPLSLLAILLDHTRDNVFRALDLELQRLDLTRAQLKIIVALGKEKEGASLAGLAHATERELHSVSSLVSRMTQMGLVEKSKGGGARQARYVLTGKGVDLYENRITSRSIHMIFGSLSEDERRQLAILLKKVQDKARSLLGLDYRPPFLDV